MANKLYFYYGVMNSSKSANALMTRYNYISSGFNVLLLQSAVNDRFGTDGQVKSRIGLSAPCVKVGKTDNIIEIFAKENFVSPVDVIIVDEAQFLSATQVDQLKELSLSMPVLCFGLKTNFKTQLFEGSKRLIELADKISEIKSVCKCGSKATINARYVDGKITLTGQEILIGAEETYKSLCFNCFKAELEKQNISTQKMQEYLENNNN